MTDDSASLRGLLGIVGLLALSASALALLLLSRDFPVRAPAARRDFDRAAAPVARPAGREPVAPRPERPPDGPVAAERPPVYDARRAALERACAAGAEAAGRGDFRRALEAIAECLRRVGTSDVRILDRVDPLIEEWERGLPCQDRLDEASDALADGRFADAERALAEVREPPPAVLAATLASLRSEVAIRRVRARAEALYGRGEGERAAAELESATDPAAVELRARIRRVLELSAAARAAAEAGRDNEAILHWLGVLEEEPDPDNAYRRAAAVVPEIRERCRRPADRELAAGSEELRAARWSEARAHFDRALELYPHHEEAEAAVRAFCADAERDLNSDLARYHKGELGFDLVIARIEAAIAFLRPADGEIHAAFLRAHERLRARRR